jgi:7-cyano-7-deazaguanine reductase
MTGIPDLYTVRLIYTPGAKVPELKSLKYYFLAFRDVPVLHEHLAGRIFEDFNAAVEPAALRVELEAAVRGGIRTKVVKTGDDEGNA